MSQEELADQRSPPRGIVAINRRTVSAFALNVARAIVMTGPVKRPRSIIAGERAQDGNVKAVAAKMVKVHTQTTRQLKSTLTSLKLNVALVSPPAHLDDRRQGMIDELRGATRIVQRVPVRMRLPKGRSDADRLRLGRSADVTVRLR